MTQNQILNALAKKRFVVNHTSYDEYEGGTTCYLSRRNPKLRAMTQLVEVAPNGLCNGESLGNFLKHL